MVLAFSFGVVGFVLGGWLVARAALAIMGRLGLELVPVMLWLGLAEEPPEVRRKHRRRLGELIAEPPRTWSQAG